jgi:aminoglycoside/choline kinase family phosphotransferase
LILQNPAREDARLALLRPWVQQASGWGDFDLAPASEDASFRRYFRITHAGETLIVMDAPPEKEDLDPYLRIASMLQEVGLNAPRVLARNTSQGFLLLSDLGSRTYLAELEDRSTANTLYRDAIDALVQLQSRGRACATALPPYDEKLLRFEMSLFTDWLLDRHLRLALAVAERKELDDVFDRLVANALRQPRVFVHRDYHSRNLMVCERDNPGILDFQDAVQGPLTYDLASLLRDCYIAWPPETVDAWALDYREKAAAEGLDVGRDGDGFLRWFDLMGVQRHLKASGIFARLWHRDGKPGYLPDVPRTLQYIQLAARRQPDLEGLAQVLQERVLPALAAVRPVQTT